MSDTVSENRPSASSMGSLRGCLMEGDPAEQARANRLRRKALALSILLQGIALSLVILIPLIWAGERIAFAGSPPQPIYIASGGRPRSPDTARPAQRNQNRFCAICTPSEIRPLSNSPARNSQNGANEDDDIPVGDGPYVPGIEGGTELRRGVVPPPPPPDRPRRISEPVIQASLVNRIEPVYPALAIQLRRSGRVELHAIIATDGTIQSLAVVSGDPLFYASALEAVRRWRYRPTLLNGQPVEVDTIISVFYHLQ